MWQQLMHYMKQLFFSKPLYERVVTISGDVENPANYRMPLGVPVDRFLERSSNKYKKGYKVIFGGPMTGGSVASLQIHLLKQQVEFFC